MRREDVCSVDADVSKRPVVVVGLCLLYSIHYFHSFDDLTENRVLGVEMRRSSLLEIHIGELAGKGDELLCVSVDTLLCIFEHVGIEAASGDNVELTHGRLHLRIGVVSLSRGSHCPTLMEELWPSYFCGYLVGFITALAEQLSRLCMSAGTIARLNHETVDDPVEEDAIVVALGHQFQEVIAVLRCLVVEFDDHFSAVGFEYDLWANIARLSPYCDRQDKGHEKEF